MDKKLLQQENEQLIKLVENLRSQLSFSANEKDELRDKITMLETSIRQLQNDLNCAVDKNEKLESDINNVTERMQGFLESVNVDKIMQYQNGTLDIKG